MITGTIALKSGGTIEITDEVLVANCLSASYSTCGRDFTIGTFNAAEMQLKIYDGDSLNHEFDGAVIELTYSEEPEEGEEEAEVKTVPLGVFIVDGDKTERIKDTVKLTAYDKAFLFDAELPDSIRGNKYTPFEALTLACEAVGVTLGTESLDDFPNNAVNFGIESKSLQSYRDLVMWTAQLLCCNAMMDRAGKLILRSAKYSSEGGAISADYIVAGNERISTVFSDTQTYIKYLSAYSGGKVKNYKSDIEPWDTPVRAGAYNAFKNPLMDSLSEAECDTVNTEWLKYVDNFGTRRIKAKLFSRPEIVPGDTLKFKGGSIDLGRNIVGVVTSVNWRYRGGTTVTCGASAIAREGEV